MTPEEFDGLESGSIIHFGPKHDAWEIQPTGIEVFSTKGVTMYRRKLKKPPDIPYGSLAYISKNDLRNWHIASDECHSPRREY